MELMQTLIDEDSDFHLVSPNSLMCKICNYGISGNLLLCIRNFLSHRRQQIWVNST